MVGRAVVPPSLDHTIDRIAPHLPTGLVSAAARRDLASVAARLPASLTNRLYFETPLHASSSRVDLILRVDQDTRGKLVPPELTLFERPLPDGPIWRRVRRLAAEWESPQSILNGGARVLWLEFDIEPGAAGSRARDSCVPGVFLDFAPSAYGDPSSARRFDLVAAAVAPLAGDTDLSRAFALVRRCIDALPAAAAIASVGMLLPRGTSTIRLCLKGLGDPELSAFLRAIDWPGDVGQVESVRESLVGPDDVTPRHSLIHLDVGAELTPRVGMEYRLDRRSQLRGAIAETGFLDRLVQTGLAMPAKRDAMLAWPGCTLEQMPHELWPSLVLRRVNHVKVICDAAVSPAAKGYLSVGHAIRAARHDIGARDVAWKQASTS